MTLWVSRSTRGICHVSLSFWSCCPALTIQVLSVEVMRAGPFLHSIAGQRAESAVNGNVAVHSPTNLGDSIFRETASLNAGEALAMSHQAGLLCDVFKKTQFVYRQSLEMRFRRSTFFSSFFFFFSRIHQLLLLHLNVHQRE